MTQHRFQSLSNLALVILDALITMLAFVIAYYLRANIPFPAEPVALAPLASYTGLIILQAICVMITMFFYRMYHLVRSRVDQFYAIFGAVSIGSLLAVSFSTIFSRTRRSKWIIRARRSSTLGGFRFC